MQYRVNLHSLQCHVPDEAGLDEIFLKYNGVKIWPAIANHNQVKVGVEPLDLELGPHDSDVKMVIELWDHDTLSPNDHLGDFILEPDRLGSYSTDLSVRSGSHKYTLYWEVD